MGWTIGIPSMKLSTTNNKSKHCGNFYLVAAEALKERINFHGKHVKKCGKHIGMLAMNFGVSVTK